MHLHINGRLTQQFLHERYWERLLPKPPFWAFKDKRCISRAGKKRSIHTLDKDNRCIFCDYLSPV